MLAENTDTATRNFKKILLYGGLVGVACVLALLIVRAQLMAVGGLIVAPFAIFFLVKFLKNPRYGLFMAVHLGFFAIGVTRYLPAPMGLSIDLVLVLALLGAIFTVDKKEATYLKNPATWIILAWFVFTVLEIFNPESRKFEAWFYAVRGISLYMMIAVPLALILLRKREHIDTFLHIWLIWSAIGALYGMKQLYIGLDAAEQAWLEAGNAKTHILHGRLRVFSFYSDAGQFGAAQAHAMMVAIILALGPFSTRRRILYLVAGLLCFWGMAISGTRGALFVPLTGFMAYFILSKNFKILTLGLLIGGGCFGILKFTFIGQGNYQIQRMRSALDPNDASFQVRLENQKKLSAYLKSRPIGGGIGSSGYWGLRFAPHTFLAQTPTDSWYVKIWAETGVVGLTLHIMMLLGIVGLGFVILFNLKDPLLRQQCMAMHSGIVGIAVASYGNQVLGQMPTGIVIYLSIAFIFMAKDLDTKNC